MLKDRGAHMQMHLKREGEGEGGLCVMSPYNWPPSPPHPTMKNGKRNCIIMLLSCLSILFGPSICPVITHQRVVDEHNLSFVCLPPTRPS